MEQFRASAKEDLRLNSDLEPDVYIRGDRTQMDRLVTNLLANALKYTPREAEFRLCFAQTPPIIYATRDCQHQDG